MPAAAAWIARIGPPCETTRTSVPGMRLRDPGQRGEDARRHVGVALAVLPALAAVEPAPEALWKAGLDVRAAEARPAADVDLAEVVNRARLETCARAHDRRRLEGAAERARVDGARGSRHRQLVGERFGLAPAELRQRPVAEPLKAVRRVPVALAVAREVDRGHSGSLRITASSPALKERRRSSSSGSTMCPSRPI